TIVTMALIMTIAMATTTTFAWFTANYNASVQPIELQAKTMGGILISATGVEGTFKAVLNSTDITKTYTSNLNMDAITPNVGVDKSWIKDTTKGFEFKKSDGKLLDVGGVYVPSTGAGAYYEFELYIKAEEAVDIKYSDIKVDVQSAGATDSIQAWPQVDATGKTEATGATAGALVGVDIAQYFTDEVSLNAYIKAYSVANLSFVNCTYDAEKGIVFNSGKTYSDIKVIVSTGSLIYSRASNAARVAFFDCGEVGKSATTTYKCVVNPNSANGFNAGNLQQDYYKYVNGVDAVVTDETITPLYTTTGNMISDATNSNFIQIAGSKTNLIMVRVWIEGTDGDCFNAILNDHLTIALAFKATQTPKPKP
ncbi:MAG: hypothetical protein RR307_05460, partial [Clostridia bacterium]